MLSHSRAMIAATSYAIVTGKSVAGLYDHAAGHHLRIAAECRGGRVQALDGDRSAKFGGTLPNLYDDGTRAFVSFEADGESVRGFDHASSGHYMATVGDRTVQLYDHAQSQWFAYDLQTLEDVISG